MKLLVFEDRSSDSPLVERVWRCHSEQAGTFLSVAASHCELVVTRHRGRVRMTVRGPETRPTPVSCPADGEWIGIRLSIGSWLPLYPAATLRDRRDVDLPGAGPRSFRLDNAVWEYPSFENAEVLVAQLARAHLLVRDRAVSAALAGDWPAVTRRSAQRHFRLATGMTHRTYRQIQRARYAAGLLRSGAAIGETVHQAGYFDQAHLTRSLRRLIGETPGRIRRHERQLSFLYKTSLSGGGYLDPSPPRAPTS
jgi:helix-turn-helix protein